MNHSSERHKLSHKALRVHRENRTRKGVADVRL